MKKVLTILFLMVFGIGAIQADQLDVPCDTTIVIKASAKPHYRFVKWSDDNTDSVRTLSNIKNDINLTAIFEAEKYTATFKDCETDIVFATQTDVPYLTTPVYGEDNPTPTRASDDQYDYTFDSWSPNIGPIEGNTVYCAQFTKTLRKYQITFENDNHDILQQSVFEYGSTPIYDGPEPTKSNDAQYTYKFIGWSPEISPVTGEATYTAVYDTTVNTYHITFKNEDGTIFDEGDFEYGEMPAPDPSKGDPVKESDGQNTYSFAGWSPTVVSVSGNAEYIATFSSSAISYKVTLISDKPEVGSVSGEGTYVAGRKLQISATATDDCWEFEIWSDGDKNATRIIDVDSDIELTAYFRQKRYTVTINSDDTNQGTVSFVVSQ